MEGQFLRGKIVAPWPEEVAEAARMPNGWVYRIRGNFSESEMVPSEAIIGAWKVNSEGIIEGDFMPNPNFKVSS